VDTVHIGGDIADPQVGELSDDETDVLVEIS